MTVNVLQASNLSIGYQHSQKKKNIILQDLNLNIVEGELVCLLGPNGVGKSTLIRTLSGIQKALAGKIYLLGDEILKLSAIEKAARVSIVLTDKVNIDYFSVYSVIALGRNPYTSWLGKLNAKDKEVIQSTIELMELTKFCNRNVNELSDGELQKVIIGRALAQESPLMLLDEPTAYLDFPTKMEIMHLLKKFTRELNKAIVISTHDFDLALQLADKICLIHTDGTMKSGAPEDLIINGNFEEVFNKKNVLFDTSLGKFKIKIKKDKEAIMTKGESMDSFWTRKALEREGYISPIYSESIKSVEIIIEGENKIWRLNDGFKTTLFTSIYELLSFIKRN